MIDSLFAALDERTVAKEVSSRHDDARLSYPLRRNTVESYEEFIEILGDYYNHHFSTCISTGGRLGDLEAQQRAKELVDQIYRRQGTDIMDAFNNAQHGLKGGMRVQLDVIADALKQESVERYVNAVFDQYVSPASWEDQVAIIEQFIARYGSALGSNIDRNDPKRYARNYRELIREFIRGLDQLWSGVRKL